MRGSGFRVVLLMVVIAVFFVDIVGVSASNRGAREKELSRNGAVHQERYDEILNNLDDYAYVENFKLTRYIPRDATEKGWENTTKGTSGKSVKSVHWYKEGGNWVFSSASAERYEIAKDKFSGKNFTETTETLGGDNRKIFWQMKFTDNVSTEDRKSIMPYQCRAYVQYAGDPFSGAHGFVDWGSVAADVAHNKILKKDAKLFVEGYGKADVHDVGGAIRGRHLDLFMDNCEDGYSGGVTNNALVIFEKSKSSIKDGKPVTKEILDRVMASKKWGDNGATVGTGTSPGTGGDSGGSREIFNPFSQDRLGATRAGVDGGEVNLPGELSYVVSGATKTIYKIAQIVMVLFVLVLIVLVSLQVASLAIQPGTGTTFMIKNEEKINNFLFGESLAKDRKKILLTNFFTLIIASVLVLGNMYVPIQGRIYMGIEYIISFIF